MRARIDNSSYVNMQPTENKNLFVLKWNPSEFRSGLHRIIVKAKVSGSILIFRLIDNIDHLSAFRLWYTLCTAVLFVFIRVYSLNCWPSKAT